MGNKVILSNKNNRNANTRKKSNGISTLINVVNKKWFMTATVCVVVFVLLLGFLLSNKGAGNKVVNSNFVGYGSKVIYDAAPLPPGDEVKIPKDDWSQFEGTAPHNAKARLNKYLKKSDYEELFPNRYGFGKWTPYPDSTQQKFDFYSYDNLSKAIENMANVVYILDYREGQTWNQQMFVLHKDNNPNNTALRVREDEFFNLAESWVQNRPIIREIIDFGDFLNWKYENDSKREIAALLGIITQETAESVASDINTKLTTGLYWNEEIGFIVGQYQAQGYRDEEHKVYPPVDGKSYHGRGAIQLSWNYNYGLVSEIFFLDKNVLLKNPEKIVEDGVLGWMAVLAFWMTPQMPKSSCHQVLSPDFKFPNPDDAKKFTPGFGLVIIIVNGGMECGLKEGHVEQDSNGYLVVKDGDYRIWTRVNMYRKIASMNGADLTGEKLDTFGMPSWL
ncbi:MAG: chitinase [Clostridiales bacterium]|jgi:hypothetical protein|nr:chitinase [Clostridiales bacterium]